MSPNPHRAEDEAIAVDAVDLPTLITQNKALTEENKSLQDRLLRTLADGENVRRQAERTAAQTRQYAIADFARELLDVVDNLARTLEAAKELPNDEAHSSLLEGVQATLRSFLRTLEKFGVRKIDALGKPFDPNLHDAILAIADPTVPPGTITEVVEEGYIIRDRLLRPARVVVAKEPAMESERKLRSPQEPEDNDLGSDWGAHSRDHDERTHGIGVETRLIDSGEEAGTSPKQGKDRT